MLLCLFYVFFIGLIIKKTVIYTILLSLFVCVLFSSYILGFQCFLFLVDEYNNYNRYYQMIILIGSGCVLLLMVETFSAEASVLMIIVMMGTLTLICSSNFLSIYLAIELQTFPIFLLVTQKKGYIYSAEAGLKYFILSALSSGVFLFGCSFFYQLIGDIDLVNIKIELTKETIGDLFITVALLFKIAAAPFHIWAPDVYSGAPSLITALLIILPKIGVFSILIPINFSYIVLLVSVICSILIGSIGGLNQTKIKRLLAYSGINHIGFILFGLLIKSPESVQASLIYLTLYVFMSICIFSIIILTKSNLILEFKGLSRAEPLMSFILAISILSFAGIPPFIGFLSKWLILMSGIIHNFYFISIISIICSMIAGVYYIRMVRVIYYPLKTLWVN